MSPSSVFLSYRFPPWFGVTTCAEFSIHDFLLFISWVLKYRVKTASGDLSPFPSNSSLDPHTDPSASITNKDPWTSAANPDPWTSVAGPDTWANFRIRTLEAVFRIRIHEPVLQIWPTSQCCPIRIHAPVFVDPDSWASVVDLDRWSSVVDTDLWVGVEDQDPTKIRQIRICNTARLKAFILIFRTVLTYKWY